MTNGTPDTETTPGASAPGAPGVPDQIRARHLAAVRTPPLACGPHRDPLLCEATPSGPSSYSLTAPQLAAEIARCRARGFNEHDIAARFTTRQGATA